MVRMAGVYAASTDLKWKTLLFI